MDASKDMKDMKERFLKMLSKQSDDMEEDVFFNPRSSNMRYIQSSEIDISALAIDEKSCDSMEEEMKASTAKELRMLSFANPGPSFMTNFDPERSSREMRKVNRRIYKENVRKNQLYDDEGHLLADNRDLCDCLEPACQGCHFPCQRCGSEKCGHECRCNRKWYYLEVEIEGTNKKVMFQNTPQSSKGSSTS